MPRTKTVDIDVADASLTGFASNVTGASFTITTTATSDGLAHQVSIRNDAATDHSGKTVALVGTDADDQVQTETVTGPGNAATVESSKYFKTLTSATPSATIGSDTFDIGWVDEVASKTIMLNRHAETGAMVQVDVTGTIDFTIQETASPIRSGYSGQTSIPWIDADDTDLVTTAADTVAKLSPHATACRVQVNSYSSGAELQVYISEGQ
jgi:hypothetical protein